MISGSNRTEKETILSVQLIELINLYENRTEILGLNIFQANLNNKSLDQIDCMNEEELFEEIKYIKEKIAIQADNYGYESDDDDMLIKGSRTRDDDDMLIKGSRTRAPCGIEGCNSKSCYFDPQSNHYVCNKHVPDDEEGRYYTTRRLRLYRENQNNRRETDPLFALRAHVGNRLKLFLTSKGIRKDESTMDYYVQTTLPKLKDHLQGHKNWEQSWDWTGEGRKLWDIDHIMPYNAMQYMIKADGITKEICIRRLSHWSNLQPLDVDTNRSQEK